MLPSFLPKSLIQDQSQCGTSKSWVQPVQRVQRASMRIRRLPRATACRGALPVPQRRRLPRQTSDAAAVAAASGAAIPTTQTEHGPAQAGVLCSVALPAMYVGGVSTAAWRALLPPLGASAHNGACNGQRIAVSTAEHEKPPGEAYADSLCAAALQARGLTDVLRRHLRAPAAVGPRPCRIAEQRMQVQVPARHRLVIIRCPSWSS